MLEYTFSADGFESLPKLKKYCSTKLVTLEKYVPRRARASAKLDVRFWLDHAKRQKTCRLVLVLPEAVLTVTETTDHAYAALDIAAAEIKRQLAEYKAKHSKQAIRHAMARVVHRADNQDLTRD